MMVLGVEVVFRVTRGDDLPFAATAVLASHVSPEVASHRHKHKYPNTNTQIEIDKYKYTNTTGFG